MHIFSLMVHFYVFVCFTVCVLSYVLSQRFIFNSLLGCYRLIYRAWLLHAQIAVHVLIIWRATHRKTSHSRGMLAHDVLETIFLLISTLYSAFCRRKRRSISRTCWHSVADVLDWSALRASSSIDESATGLSMSLHREHRGGAPYEWLCYCY